MISGDVADGLPAVSDKWLDENPPSDADRRVGATDTFVQPWTAFDHPQLGSVEIGGIDSKRCVQNPPAALLEAECEKNTAFSLALLGSLPSVSSAVVSEALTEEGAARVTMTLSNQGFLPTHGAQRAVEMNAVRGEHTSNPHRLGFEGHL